MTTAAINLQKAFDDGVFGMHVLAIWEEAQLRGMTHEEVAELAGSERASVTKFLNAWTEKPKKSTGNKRQLKPADNKNRRQQRASIVLKVLSILGDGYVHTICSAHEAAVAGFQSAMVCNRKARLGSSEPKWPLTLYTLTTLYVLGRVKDLGLIGLSVEDLRSWVDACINEVRQECEFFAKAKRKKKVNCHTININRKTREILQVAGPVPNSMAHFTELSGEWMLDFQAVHQKVSGLDAYYPRLGWDQFSSRPMSSNGRIQADASVVNFYDTKNS